MYGIIAAWRLAELNEWIDISWCGCGCQDDYLSELYEEQEVLMEYLGWWK